MQERCARSLLPEQGRPHNPVSVPPGRNWHREPGKPIEFEAEVAQVLPTVTHSLYSHKEISHRELISTPPTPATSCGSKRWAEPTSPMAMRTCASEVSWDPERAPSSVRDNGIGMSKDEVVASHRHDRQFGRLAAILRPPRASGSRRPPDRPDSAWASTPPSSWPTRSPSVTRRAGASLRRAAGVRWESDGKGESTPLRTPTSPSVAPRSMLHHEGGRGRIPQVVDAAFRRHPRKYSGHVALRALPRDRRPAHCPPPRMCKPDPTEWTTVSSASTR